MGNEITSKGLIVKRTLEQTSYTLSYLACSCQCAKMSTDYKLKNENSVLRWRRNLTILVSFLRFQYLKLFSFGSYVLFLIHTSWFYSSYSQTIEQTCVYHIDISIQFLQLCQSGVYRETKFYCIVTSKTELFTIYTHLSTLVGFRKQNLITSPACGVSPQKNVWPK